MKFDVELMGVELMGCREKGVPKSRKCDVELMRCQGKGGQRRKMSDNSGLQNFRRLTDQSPNEAGASKITVLLSMAQPVGYRLTLGAKKLERKDFGGLGKSGMHRFLDEAFSPSAAPLPLLPLS